MASFTYTFRVKAGRINMGQAIEGNTHTLVKNQTRPDQKRITGMGTYPNTVYLIELTDVLYL